MQISIAGMRPCAKLYESSRAVSWLTVYRTLQVLQLENELAKGFYVQEATYLLLAAQVAPEVEDWISACVSLRSHWLPTVPPVSWFKVPCHLAGWRKLTRQN